MKAAPVPSPDYNARIRRAELLASQYPFAAEVLNFYRHIAELQKHLYAQIVAARITLAKSAEAPLRLHAELLPVLPLLPEFLDRIAKIAPAPVAQAAELLASSGESLFQLLTGFWISDRASDVASLVAPAFPGGTSHFEDAPQSTPDAASDQLREFCLRAFSQPYAEFLAQRMAEPPAALTVHRECPRCGSAPFLSVLRQEGDGGKRRLLCSFCLQEWDFRRIYCAACGEEDEKKVPVYVAEQFPHIRVECCDTCNTYLPTIDLTKDGHAIPIVDDLAALPLSLWAHEHRYTRLHPNLLST